MTSPIKRSHVESGAAAIPLGVYTCAALQQHDQVFLSLRDDSLTYCSPEDCIDLMRCSEEIALQILTLLGYDEDHLVAFLQRRETFSSEPEKLL